MPNDSNKLLTTDEAAKILGLRPTTLIDWRCRQTVPLPFVKAGKSVRYRPTDLERFIESNIVTPRSA